MVIVWLVHSNDHPYTLGDDSLNRARRRTSDVLPFGCSRLVAYPERVILRRRRTGNVRKIRLDPAVQQERVAVRDAVVSRRYALQTFATAVAIHERAAVGCAVGDVADGDAGPYGTDIDRTCPEGTPVGRLEDVCRVAEVDLEPVVGGQRHVHEVED